ncbi:MAG: efflux RND transporter periplasmic adaptor subunit [Anaerolineales bacterium]|jgi:HlyD family secretion protein|nr:efflux RND transporter periplasmic adaptor subunit [Anaerolineales bacterium]
MAFARLKTINKKTGWGLAALILLGLAAFYFYGQSSQKTSLYQTEPVKRGDLTANVGATGTVRARQSATLLWQAQGRVEAVNVKIGDSVKAEQVLAFLAPSSLSQGMLLSQSELIAAQTRLETVLFSNLPLAQAQQNLANAKQAAENAQSKYDVLNRPRVSEALIDQTLDGIEATRDQLKSIRALYERFYDYQNMDDSRPAKAEMTLTLLNIQNNLDRQIALYNWYTSAPDPLEVERSLASLKLVQARLQDAQREVDRLADGQNVDEIAAAQAQVNAAQATVNLSKIIAPFDGVITEANPQPADMVTPGKVALRIEDLSQLYVDLQISEVDINLVEPGQSVILVFDAIPGKTFTGQIVTIDLVGRVSGGAANFAVTVAMTGTDPLVKPGMTAAVTVAVKEVENALLVPNRAVRVLNGERVVYVLVDNQPLAVKIRLGTITDLYSEVASGDLNVGDLLVMNSITP